MKKTNSKYLLFGLIGVIVIGAVVLLTQYSGQMFQGDLIRSVSTYPVTTTSPISTTSTAQFDYLGMIQKLEKRVLALETANTVLQNKINTTNATLKQTNTAVEGSRLMFNYLCKNVFTGYEINYCIESIDRYYSINSTSY